MLVDQELVDFDRKVHIYRLFSVQLTFLTVKTKQNSIKKKYNSTIEVQLILLSYKVGVLNHLSTFVPMIFYRSIDKLDLKIQKLAYLKYVVIACYIH